MANSSGTRVSFMPRSAPAATVWMPSAMKKVDPTNSSVAESSSGRIGALAEEKLRNAEAADDHGERQDGSEHDAEPGRDIAGAPDRAGVAAADGVADPHGRGHADAERHHEQDRGDLQRDLVRGERGRADQAHQ